MIKEKKQKSKARVIVDGIFIILFAVLFVLLIFVGVSVFRGYTPSIFGYSVLNVKTGSMENTIKTGSVILVKNLNAEDIENLRENQDIVVYRSVINGVNVTVTHRVIENNTDERYLITKGDANPVDDGKIEYNRVIAKYVKTLGFLSFIYKMLSSVWGFLLLIIIPSLILLATYIISIAKQSVLIKNQKDDEIENARIEELKKQAIEEYLNGRSEEDSNKKK